MRLIVVRFFNDSRKWMCLLRNKTQYSIWNKSCIIHSQRLDCPLFLPGLQLLCIYQVQKANYNDSWCQQLAHNKYRLERSRARVAHWCCCHWSWPHKEITLQELDWVVVLQPVHWKSLLEVEDFSLSHDRFLFLFWKLDRAFQLQMTLRNLNLNEMFAIVFCFCIEACVRSSGSLCLSGLPRCLQFPFMLMHFHHLAYSSMTLSFHSCQWLHCALVLRLVRCWRFLISTQTQQDWNLCCAFLSSSWIS